MAVGKTYETNIDGEDEESRGGKEDGGRYESLKEPANVIHHELSVTPGGRSTMCSCSLNRYAGARREVVAFWSRYIFSLSR